MIRCRAALPWIPVYALLAIGFAGLATGLLAACGPAEPPARGTVQESIIYGADERSDYYELTDPVVLMVASADVVLFDTSLVTPNTGGYDLDLYRYGTFGQYFDLCPSEPYASQPDPGFCSGFKVGDDLIVTAGHCVDTTYCATTAFVFGFVMLDAATPVGWVGADDVYFCSEIVGRAYTATDDWAVVRVDRAIVGRPSLPVRRSSAVESDPEVFGLFVVGHPGGIPLKQVGGAGPAGDTGLRGASVRSTAADYFQSDLDVYAGNSGSAVYSLNQQGELLYVEGILVRGNPDWTRTGNCNVSNVCSETTGCGGTWEDVSRATKFEWLVPPPCGDDLCDDGQDCLSCPADCGTGTPGPTLLNEDFSAGLGSWTVSAGWTTGALHVATDYPAGGSGAPVASISGCIDCTLTLSSSIDVTPYCAVRLSFWRFVDGDFDNGDYFELRFWNGSGWDNLRTWSDGNGDSGRWEYEEIALDSANLISDFTFGFRFSGNQAKEIVQIDDVTVWTHQPSTCTVDTDCDDGLFCNGAETCDAVLGCRPGTPPALDDGVGCTVDVCDEASDTVIHAPTAAACDDGLFCNGAETCDAVLGCRPGPPPALDDGVGCTVDVCDEASDTVTHTPGPAVCDDGLFCNGAETCDAVLGCRPGTPPALDDGVGCTVDVCDEASDTVIHAPTAAACDDGLFCNGAETCDAVLGCRPGTPPALDDGVGCTVDACDEVADAVTHTPDDALCDDANPCTSDTCGAGGCVHAPTAAGEPCDDGNACTQTDTCQGGECTGEDPLPCPAPDACHQAGTCDPVTGLCTNPVSPDGTPCPEGSCRNGLCEPDDASAHSPGCGCRGGSDAPLGSILLILMVEAVLCRRRRRRQATEQRIGEAP